MITETKFEEFVDHELNILSARLYKSELRKSIAKINKTKIYKTIQKYEPR
jgi:hypothetical protein